MKTKPNSIEINRGRTAWQFLPAITSLLLAPIDGDAATIAGPITNPANNHSYYLLSTSDWLSSESEALTLGGHLATINDAAENAWVFATFSDFNATQRNLWIGLNDSAVEGTFVWISGEPVTYLNWAAIEPNNNGNEDYAMIYTTTYGSKWNDAQANAAGITGAPTFGVVEVVPEPTSAILSAIGLGLICARRRSFRNRHERA